MLFPQDFSPGVRALFLDAVRRKGIIGDGCKATGISRKTVEKYRDSDPDFAEKLADAIEDGIDRLEGAAFDRAVHGVEKGVYYKGDLVGEETIYSDSLLALLITRRRYKETVRSEVDATINEPMSDTKKAAIIAGIIERAKARRAQAQKDAEDLV